MGHGLCADDIYPYCKERCGDRQKGIGKNGRQDMGEETAIWLMPGSISGQ